MIKITWKKTEGGNEVLGYMPGEVAHRFKISKQRHHSGEILWKTEDLLTKMYQWRPTLKLGKYSCEIWAAA